MTSSIFKLASARMLIGEAIAEIGGRERPDPSGEAAERFERILDDAAPLPRTTPTLESLIDAGLRFGTIYADPPWQYDNTSCRGAAENHYATMTVDAIAALPISQLAAPHAHLHLWTTNAFLFDAPRVMASWGFTYKSCLVWTKPQFGNGNYWRVSHEFLLLGVRGEAVFADKSQQSWLHADRTKHSSKPTIFRKLIERVSPVPRLELFARSLFPHWTCWGNQIELDLFTALESDEG